jgi:signal transduction histidine kinase
VAQSEVGGTLPPAVPAPGWGRQSFLALFGVLSRRRAYRNLPYLMLALPLGLGYTLLIALGLTLGLALIPLLVGFPILGLTVSAWWRLAAFERHMAIWWLGVDVPPLVHPRVAPGRWRLWALWRLAWAYLTSQQSWTALAFLLLKVPLGLLALVATGAPVAVAGGLLAWPLPRALGFAGGEVSPGALVGATALGLTGAAAAGAVALHAGNALAGVTRKAARLMLGSSDTARRLAEAEAVARREQVKAARAELSRKELIVNVGHELRTPTASIRGHVESLLLSLEPAEEGRPGSPPGPDELRHHLGIVQRETDRLGGMIDELLTLARADAGELRLELAPVGAGEVVEEVHQTLAPLARRERQVTLIREVAPGLPPVLADRQRLVQVLLNLVRNAISYTPEGGIVSVSVAPAGPGRLGFCVADTGVGIPPEALPHVFERFYRADASRARASGGFGLGLSIVRDLVQAMGGTVEVESVQGEGSRFLVLLPGAPAVGG